MSKAYTTESSKLCCYFNSNNNVPKVAQPVSISGRQTRVYAGKYIVFFFWRRGMRNLFIRINVVHGVFDDIL